LLDGLGKVHLATRTRMWDEALVVGALELVQYWMMKLTEVILILPLDTVQHASSLLSSAGSLFRSSTRRQDVW
jgi:hypothetical protein